ncbi:MAG: 3-hydroxybutyryl-CoA dehydrogenase [Firmicutes bacterium]|nr:3-hydroxybutyryl-CoA dehydrogenase [Bacillota bacterium]
MKVCIIGAGTMGSGIAHAFAQAGDQYEVFSTDITKELADKGIGKVAAGMAKRVAKGKMAQEEMDAILGRIKTGVKEDFIADADLVIEASTENPEIKRALFKEMDEMAKEGAILASNTSTLSITQLNQVCKRPIIGMHFFNPAPVMKLVEVTAGLNTPESMVDEVMAISKDLGKNPVKVNEAPGFIVNRMLIPMINEAVFTLAEGVATAEDIDSAMKDGAGHPMGPLHLADLIGLDVCLFVMEILYNEFADSKYRPCPLLTKMVRGGTLGCKTGEGFFKY